VIAQRHPSPAAEPKAIPKPLKSLPDFAGATSRHQTNVDRPGDDFDSLSSAFEHRQFSFLPAMTTTPEVVFPRTQRDLFPAAAQALYISTYKKSMAESVKGDSSQLSPESVASRDAWDAVFREYTQDPVTHKWGANAKAGMPASLPPVKNSLLNTFRNLFKPKQG
jgi:cation transport regulator ChaB